MISILNFLVLPSGMASLLFVAALLTYFYQKTRRASWWLLVASGTITITFSSGVVATALISPLEYRYPAIHDVRDFPSADHIVVLTGYAADDLNMPVTGRLHTSSAYRVTMALQLSNDCSTCKVLVSGDSATAKVMGEVLVELGLPANKLSLETKSRTTAESAANLRRQLKNETFFLVSSAGHLVRALGAFEQQGLDAIPVPTDHQMPKDWRRAQWRPTPQSLVVSDLAVHEYLGMLWYRLRGRL